MNETAYYFALRRERKATSQTLDCMHSDRYINSN
jgi:hypothetical protein